MISKAEAQAWGYCEAVKAFGDTPKAKTAGDLFNRGTDYIHRMPVGFNINDNFRDKLTNHITASVKANPPKPYGFLPAIGILFVFEAILSGLISWVVEKLLEKYYGNSI